MDRIEMRQILAERFEEVLADSEADPSMDLALRLANEALEVFDDEGVGDDIDRMVFEPTDFDGGSDLSTY